MKNRIFTILASLAVVLTLGGCQTPDEFTAVRDANALTSFYNRQNDLYNFVKRNVQKSNFFAGV